MKLLLFWSAVGALAYTYAIFPIITLFRAVLLQRPYRTAPITPSVSMIVAARNEATTIEAKLDNLAALDYPRDRLEVIVVSDGSYDGTDEIVRARSDGLVRLVAPGRVGKGAALGIGVEASSGEVLVFSDANSMYERGALRALVAPFADETIGGVAGNQVYLPASSAGRADGVLAGEQRRWDVDRLFKRAQSHAGSVTGATGAIYAIRRALFRPIPEGVTDDLMNTLVVIAQGHRFVFAEDAIALEPVAPSREAEFTRKVRVMTRGLRSVLVMRELLDPRRYGFFSLQLFTHKVLMRTMAGSLIVLAVVSPTLWRRGRLYRLATVTQAAAYGIGGAALGAPGSRLGRSRLASLAGYVILVNVASLRACWNIVSGRRIDRWEPVTRGQSATPKGSVPVARIDVPVSAPPESGAETA